MKHFSLEAFNNNPLAVLPAPINNPTMTPPNYNPWDINMSIARYLKSIKK